MALAFLRSDTLTAKWKRKLGKSLNARGALPQDGTSFPNVNKSNKTDNPPASRTSLTGGNTATPTPSASLYSVCTNSEKNSRPFAPHLMERVDCGVVSKGSSLDGDSLRPPPPTPHGMAIAKTSRNISSHRYIYGQSQTTAEEVIDIPVDKASGDELPDSVGDDTVTTKNMDAAIGLEDDDVLEGECEECERLEKSRFSLKRVIKGWFAGLFGSKERKKRDKKSKGGRYVMFLIPFVTVLREGLEGMVFLGGIAISASPADIPLAAISGIICGLAIGYAVFKTGNSVKLHIFFIGASILILFLAAGLFTKAVRKFEKHVWMQAIGAKDNDGAGSFDVRTMGCQVLRS
ncbi:high-affinity iron permease [Blyttiomyces sp. JEL0837]|nr:high-affinity iron permease [Blyttiomyces sp. JEL0837]